MTQWMLANLTEKGLLWWLAAVFAIVLWRIASGSVAASGMLAHDADAARQGTPAPERVQLLATFLFALAAYVRLALTQTRIDSAHPMLPDVSAQFIALFAASHSIYLGGKLGRSVVPEWRKKSNPPSEHRGE